MQTPIAFTIPEAAEAVRIGRTSIYAAIKSGDLVARKSGRRTLITAEDLRRWLEKLPPAVSSAPQN